MTPSNPEFPSVPIVESPLTGNPSDPEERGILIGIGGQYTVHDIGNDRVMKIPNSMDGTRRFVGGWGPQIAEMTNKHRPLEETAADREYCVPHVLRLAARYQVLNDLLARPKAMPGFCFTQDKVERALKHLIPKAGPAKVRSYLDATADIYQLLWRYGIHDCIWFFLVNNGVDSHGKVVYLDFGETLFDTTRVAVNVEKREWEKKKVLVEDLVPEYQEYYFQAMKSRLSGRNFELHWGADLDDLDRMIIKRPPLRERWEEIPSLVEPILERANREEGWNISGVSPEVLDLFAQYTWTGSGAAESPYLLKKHRKLKWAGSGVELQNAVYRAAEACQSTVIQLDDLPQYIQVVVNGRQNLQ